MDATYIIPADNRPAVEDAIRKLNKKAGKLGLTAMVTVSFEHDNTEIIKDPDTGREYSREWLRCHLSGDKVVVPGYRFIATLYHTDEGTIINAVPGSQVPKEYREAPPACHHCKTVRRRNDTFLVQSDAGVTVQVGSNCLQDYLGNDPHRVAKWAELLGGFNTRMESEFAGMYGSRAPESWTLRYIMELTAVCVRKHGWLSRSKERELNEQYGNEGRAPYVATASRVSDVLFADFTKDYGRKLIEEHRASDADKAEAEAILEFAQTLENPQDSDYIANLQVVVRSDAVNGRTLGLACSLIVAYRKAMNIKAERLAAKDNPSTHVGAEGERLRNVPVVITGMKYLGEGEYGPRNLITMKDLAGNIYVWFTGSFGSVDMAQDDREKASVTTRYLTGTVKRHGEFNGVKQTEVTRCQLLDILPVTVKKARKAKKEVA